MCRHPLPPDRGLVLPPPCRCRANVCAGQQAAGRRRRAAGVRPAPGRERRGRRRQQQQQQQQQRICAPLGWLLPADGCALRQARCRCFVCSGAAPHPSWAPNLGCFLSSCARVPLLVLTCRAVLPCHVPSAARKFPPYTSLRVRQLFLSSCPPGTGQIASKAALTFGLRRDPDLALFRGQACTTGVQKVSLAKTSGSGRRLLCALWSTSAPWLPAAGNDFAPSRLYDRLDALCDDTG